MEMPLERAGNFSLWVWHMGTKIYSTMVGYETESWKTGDEDMVKVRGTDEDPGDCKAAGRPFAVMISENFLQVLDMVATRGRSGLAAGKTFCFE